MCSPKSVCVRSLLIVKRAGKRINHRSTAERRFSTGDSGGVVRWWRWSLAAAAAAVEVVD